MKATVLLGTLKRSGPSNTQTLCEFLAGKMEDQGIRCEIVKLVDHDILPGTCSDMGKGDAWPGILKKVLGSGIVIFATPIWWGNQSSEIQRAIERLDELHDGILAGKPSPLEGKAGGIVITGDSDGAEHVIGNICNFFNAVGLLIPPYATLSVLWDKQAKDKDTPKKKLLEKYESEYADTADKMIKQLKKYAREPESRRRSAK
ncbi:MAG TPA: NAD(P)H-dependent oxidoreductase [Rhodanobacteraceae bacterium]